MKKSNYKKLTFFALLLSCFCQLHNAFSQDLPFSENLKAYFKFDGDLNSTFPEISGSASATLANDRFGNANSALQFDGVDDTFSFSIDEVLSSNFSFCFRAKPESTTTNIGEFTSGTGFLSSNPQNPLLYSNNAGTSAKGFGIDLGTNGLSIVLHGTSLYTTSLNHSGSHVGWENYSFVIENNQGMVYKDRTLLKEGLSSGSIIRSSGISFGSNPSSVVGGGHNFRGSLDDLYIFDRTLSLSEVSSLWNDSPENFASIAPLSISENQATGTVVGEFNATDPDGDGMTYQLVSGAGDTNNALFILESNGTLKTAVVLDHEQNPGPLSVRVQVKDDYNATTEGNFSVTIIDTVDFTIVLNGENNNGSVTGAGQYDEGVSVNLVATPSLGYLFNGWSGDLVSSDENETITVSDDYNITATFAQDTGDTDDDGLSNYYELAILGTNPESADTDGDGFSDLDENATGIDPTFANTALYDFQVGRESTARSEGNATGYQAGFAEGNASGIAWVQQNLSAYSLVSEADKNATDLSNYLGGISDGNISGINFVRNHPATYGLYTEEEKNASDANSYTTGFTDGNTSGYAQGVEDGNGSGINYFRNNPATYGLFTEEEKNASDANSYNTGFTDGNTSGYAQGVSDGNTSGIQLVVNSPLSYQLFTLAEKEVSDAQAHELGYSDGDAAGYALGLVDGNQSGVQWLQENSEQFGFYTKEQQTSTQETSQTEGVTNAQDEVSSNGLSSLTYLEYVRQVSTLYLSGWHHKEGMGWLWTDKQTFPFVFRKESESQPEGWLYFSPLPEQASAPFYDYLRKEWVGTP
jgi:uncharacterized repeat protein (TIGR02543 family)